MRAAVRQRPRPLAPETPTDKETNGSDCEASKVPQNDSSDDDEGRKQQPFHRHRHRSSSNRRKRKKRAVIIKIFALTAVCIVLIWSIRRGRHRFRRKHAAALLGYVDRKPQANQTATLSTSSRQQDQNHAKILTIYAESPETMDVTSLPLAPRNTSADKLLPIFFPKEQGCSLEHFPVDDFPDADPFLPWIHDYFVNEQRTHVQFVAQNKRRCQTGAGNEQAMKYWEPQMALFQPIPIRVDETSDGKVQYSLSSLDNATYSETRFLCHFHDHYGEQATTFSVFPFNYEFVSWRKHRGVMFETEGSKGDTSKLETSQLVFACPIPSSMLQQQQQQDHQQQQPSFHLDLVPIRTPARRQFLLTTDHVGPNELSKMTPFDTLANYGPPDFHVLPKVADSGRWANLPVCLPPPKLPETRGDETLPVKKKHRLVACTWAAASYHRRGDATAVHDTSRRLREWILFHRLVGIDHLYIFDNTQPFNTSTLNQYPLRTIIEQEFASDSNFLTYIPWKPKICNNNRPQNAVPGERSSQYAAESSCRERFGPLTDWLAFIDIDEYLVPMASDSWNSVLDQADRDGIKVLKLKSARGRPRRDLLVDLSPNAEPQMCEDMINAKSHALLESCLVPRANETFLRVYNCDFIKLPRPERFSRAMKQIYRPDFVLQHFVHYSCVTKEMATYYKDRSNKEIFQKRVMDDEWGDAFVDELTQGVLVHTKSVLPHETIYRNLSCFAGSKTSCPVGIECPASTPFIFGQHETNSFQDGKGHYCNCWVNMRLEAHLIPKLERALHFLMGA